MYSVINCCNIAAGAYGSVVTPEAKFTFGLRNVVCELADRIQEREVAAMLTYVCPRSSPWEMSQPTRQGDDCFGS